MNEIFKIAKMDYYISKQVFSKPQTPERTTSNYEIELYTLAENISVVNGTRYRQKAGNVLVAKPGDKRYSIGSFECFCVHFSCGDPDIRAVLDTLPTVSAPADTEDIQRILKNLPASHAMNGSAKQLYLHGNVAELISVLANAETKRYRGKYDRYLPSVFSACRYIEENFGSRITLADISASANLSPGFFHAVFKEIKNTTPAEYLSALRIRRAKALLRESSLPLSEIAVECGFGSQGYFNYVFKNKTGLTPKGYRDKRQIII